MKKRKKVSVKEYEDKTHYCTKCRKRTEHRPEGIRWVRYCEKCKICGTINYSEYRRDA